MNVVSTFGRVLAEQRKKRGMSRSQLADAAELSYPYVSQLETGLRKPSRDAAARLSRALGISLFDLEAAIPINTTEEEIHRANRQSERLLSSIGSAGGPVSVMPAPAMALRASITDASSAGRDDLVGQMVDLLEEFPSDERLDVLMEVQKGAMQRMLDARGTSPA
jgi:transcriptional regulator with XRE-family HTH domain